MSKLSLTALVALAALSIVALGVALSSSDGPDADETSPPSRPNIVLIETDDQTLSSLDRKTMPATMSLLADEGTTFGEYVVASPLCCPSRASLETGQYPHNNGITANQPGYSDLRNKNNTLPTWLRRAGYSTAHLGKYMNNYDKFPDNEAEPAPGWDRWVTMLPQYSYYDYDLAIDGEERHYGAARSDYLTTVLNREAARIVREFAAKGDPFFVQIDQLAPHGQAERDKGKCGLTAEPLPGDFRRFAGEPLPRPPSFNEPDVSDKPPFRQFLEPLPEARIEAIRDNYRCRQASLRAVDRGVRRIYRTLVETGELDSTVIVFTSDNGFLQGEHRIPSQKAQSFEEAVRVPLIVRAPESVLDGAEAPVLLDASTSNIDLAPTFLEMAGAEPCRTDGPCRTLDGRSMLPLLRGEDGGFPENRGILFRFRSGHKKNTISESCAFTGIRTVAFTYAEHAAVPNPVTGLCEPADERELYDLQADPYQLESLESDEREDVVEKRLELEARLGALERCAGLVERDSRTEGRPYCE